ncbi:type II secretion system protein [Candidatus Curtissbacteria bacterium]|nr:type II secretion system protein [Candidatus Curtissbacteria bacterium]
MKHKLKGFTIIELLAAASISGILFGILYFTWWNKTQEKVRDAQRIADINSIKVSTEAFYEKNNKYPPLGAAYQPYQEEIFTSNTIPPGATDWIPELVPAFSKPLPKDPKQATLPIFLAINNFYDKVAQVFKEQLKVGDVLAAPSVVTLDSVGYVGEYTSIFCLSSTECKIAYHDKTNTSLKLVSCNDATCSPAARTVAVLDGAPGCIVPTCSETAYAGQHSSIFCLSSTDCKISYQVGAYSAAVLKMIDCDNAACSAGTITTIDSANPTGYFSKIKCPTTSDDCKIAYNQDPNPFAGNDLGLYLTDCNDPSCSTRTRFLLDGGAACALSGCDSIEAGRFDMVCLTTDDCKIAYEKDGAHLWFADCNNSACSLGSVNEVDSNTDGSGWGANPALACLTADDCKIAYSNLDTGALVFADCGDPNCSAAGVTKTPIAAAGCSKDSVCLATHVPMEGTVSQTVDIACPSATECKITHNSGGVLRLIDCDDATCTTRNTNILDGAGCTLGGCDTATLAFFIPIYCLTTTDCRIAYLDDNLGDLKYINCDSFPCAGPGPTPSPTPPPPFLYLYHVSVDRKTHNVWAYLENEKDPRIYNNPQAQCKATPPQPGYNFCGSF